ncbi:MAG TPA: glycosyltransferase [Cyclobacteriaceae bacterium]
MSTLIAFLFLFYCILLIMLIAGWRRALQHISSIKAHENDHFISILIPVRNEETTIASLLQNLKLQSYSSYEVIIIDDHSDDNTFNIVKGCVSDDRIKVLCSEGNGKKHALATGIAAASGSIIVTTDADCIADVNWLKIINRAFQDEKIKLVFGGVRIKEDGTLFSSLQQLEFGSLIGSGAATLVLGFPTMCNGANLAFRKKNFNEAGGYADHIHIPSGDDEFLLRKVASMYPEGIYFLNDKASVVTTNATETIRDFLYQRIRWAGKWKYNQSWSSKLLAVFIFLFQLGSIAAFILIAAGFANAFLTLLWIFKILLELLFLKQVNNFLGNKWKWLNFILLQLIYPVYVVCIGLISNFKSFEWKGRKLKSIHSRPVYH